MCCWGYRLSLFFLRGGRGDGWGGGSRNIKRKAMILCFLELVRSYYGITESFLTADVPHWVLHSKCSAYDLSKAKFPDPLASHPATKETVHYQLVLLSCFDQPGSESLQGRLLLVGTLKEPFNNIVHIAHTLHCQA